jgi:isopenicillin N synthase-like dioxygenase
VDYAALPIVDLSQFSVPEARAELAIQVRDAMTTHGFFYVINHGYSPEQVPGILLNLMHPALTH